MVCCAHKQPLKPVSHRQCTRVALAQALELSREVEAAGVGGAPLEERLALYDRLVAALNEAKSSVRHSISGGVPDTGISHPGQRMPTIICRSE